MAIKYSRLLLSTILKSTSTPLLNSGLWRTLVDLRISQSKPTRRGCRGGQRKAKHIEISKASTTISTIKDSLDFRPQFREIQLGEHLHNSTLNIQLDTFCSSHTNNFEKPVVITKNLNISTRISNRYKTLHEHQSIAVNTNNLITPPRIWSSHTNNNLPVVNDVENIPRNLNISTRISNRYGTLDKHQRNGVNVNNLIIPPRIPLTQQITCWSKLCILNSRSVRNKAAIVKDFVVENNIDILCLTETWLNTNDARDELTINAITPKGFLFYHIARKGRGGGVGLLYKNSLRLKKIVLKQFKSFETLGMLVSTTPTNILLFVIYRPPPSNRNKLSNKIFFEEFALFLEQFSSSPSSLLIVGDFNFHVDDLTNQAAKQFLDLLDIFDLKQFVHQPTYQDKHVLDLVITRSADHIVSNVSVRDPAISDHCAIFSHVCIKKPPPVKVVTRSRKLKGIDFQSFIKDITESALVKTPANDLTNLLHLYNSVLSSILDLHAPCTERVVTKRPQSPWYTTEIKDEKTKRRKLERRWRQSRLTIDRELYIQQCQVVRNLIDFSKHQYYSNMISEHPSDQRVLFSTFTKMLHVKAEKHYPNCSSPDQLANSFADFFENKIITIQHDLHVVKPVNVMVNHVSCNSSFSSFSEISPADLSKLITPLTSKSCNLDPIPSLVMKQCFDTLFPTISTIINLSLRTGVVPPMLKEAMIHPLLKKPNLPCDELSSFRPISNLTFLSKSIEKVVALQLGDYLEMNDLHEKFQSAYKKHHSVETALVRVQNDVLHAIDNHHSVILVLLDLSAAFDTVNHVTLLKRLAARYGIGGTVLEWFRSYLCNRKSFVCVDGCKSQSRSVTCGVPQGSVLGPILFMLYTSPIGDIVRSYNINFHLYADDSQLYISFTTSSTSQLDSAKVTLEACVNEIDKWMQLNSLKMNGDKTEIILLSSAFRPRPSIDSVNIAGHDILFSAKARNIGVILDDNMSLDNHIASICKSCFFHLRNISKIRKHISVKACETIIHALISSKLDFCNSLLYGLSITSLKKLQYVQNAAARVLTFSHKYDHISPILRSLHWLPIEQRIQYKVLLLTFKVLNNCAPAYLSDLLKPYKPTRTLRSSGLNLLSKPSYNLNSYGKRAFSCAAPELWNTLPANIRSSTSISAFKRLLKTWLFKQAYPD